MFGSGSRQWAQIHRLGRDDATRESKNTRIAILGLTKYRMTGQGFM